MRLVGKRGSIEVGENESVATVTDKTLEKRYGSTVTFPSEDLLTWIKLLKVWSTENGQITISHWGAE